MIFFKEPVFIFPALPLEDVFDPTGAGDTFAGGFIGYLAQTSDISFDNMKRGIIYGSAMASFCVENSASSVSFLSSKMKSKNVFSSLLFWCSSIYSWFNCFGLRVAQLKSVGKFYTFVSTIIAR